MKSMTAFASAIKEISGLTIRFNVASYNSRYIDINLTLPEFLLPYQLNIYDNLIYFQMYQKLKKSKEKRK